MSGLIERFYFKEHLLFCYFQIFVKDTKNDSCPRQERFRVLTFGNHWCSFWKTLCSQAGRSIKTCFQYLKASTDLELHGGDGLCCPALGCGAPSKVSDTFKIYSLQNENGLALSTMKFQACFTKQTPFRTFFFSNRNETFQSSVLPQK